MAINRVTIMGNLTRDAELRKKGDAASVLTFGLAINEKKKDTETGEYVEAPVFVDCALFGARAEALAPYLTKGKKVSVDGRLRYHSWMKNEEKRHALSVLGRTECTFVAFQCGKSPSCSSSACYSR